MATRFRLQRRVSGSPGAPAALLSGELAWNMADGVIYGGFGDDGGGNATSVKAMFGQDFVANLPTGGSALQNLRKNAANNGYEWYTPSTGGTYTGSNGVALVGSDFQVDFTVVAAKASPAFSGNPTAPTQLTSDDSTKLATTAYVKAVISALINAAPGALDTLGEIATQLASDESALAALVTTVSGKLQKDQNLADLTNAATARGNLGLGTMATQSAGAVTITGGTINGVTLDGGTF